MTPHETAVGWASATNNTPVAGSGGRPVGHGGLCPPYATFDQRGDAASPVGARRSVRPQLSQGRSGLTLVEVVVSTLIVGVMTIAALNALGAATRSSTSSGDRAVALGLADDLMAEILRVSYSDPDETPEFGPESSESSGPRTAFDDVDDFHNWNQKPPQASDGTVLADRDDWRRRVTVRYVEPGDPTQLTTGNVDEGAKRIHVVVEYRDTLLIEQIAVRTDK